jgi:glycosyltransferase involved in cell wall biosynthesis
MLSVVILTHNSEEGLARTLASLVSAAAEGVIREVIIADAGSNDGTAAVAEAAGCLLISAQGTWGDRVDQAIAAMRRAPWIMILPPHVLLQGEWFRELSAFVERVERSGRAGDMAASFRLEYDDFGFRARVAERAVGLCSGVLGLPVPEQGLVVSRRLWDRIGRLGGVAGYGNLVERIGRRQVRLLRANALVIAGRHTGAGVPAVRQLVGHALAACGLPGLAMGTCRDTIKRKDAMTEV